VSGDQAAELAELARQVLALSDTREAELAARLALERAAYARGLADGIEAGRAQASAELLAEVSMEKRLQVGIVRALAEAAPPAYRWHLCCHSCRLGGHRPGCGRCEDRTRETFAAPHPDDWPPALAAAHRAYLARAGEGCPVPQCPVCLAVMRGAA
jgi:hypothetical protein